MRAPRLLLLIAVSLALGTGTAHAQQAAFMRVDAPMCRNSLKLYSATTSYTELGGWATDPATYEGPGSCIWDPDGDSGAGCVACWDENNAIFCVGGGTPSGTTGSGLAPKIAVWDSSSNLSYYQALEYVTGASPALNIDSSSTTTSGVRVVTTNASGATHSFAGHTAIADVVTAVFLADGLGTGAGSSAGAYFGATSNHEANIISNNALVARFAEAATTIYGTGAALVASFAPASSTIYSSTGSGTLTYSSNALAHAGSNTSTGVLYTVRNNATATESEAGYYALADNATVGAVFLADGLGTGATGNAGAYIGTTTNHGFDVVQNGSLRTRFGARITDSVSHTFRGGTTSALTAPVYFQAGALMTAPENYALETTGKYLYFTDDTGDRNRILDEEDLPGGGSAVSGTGTSGYLALWTGTSTIGDSSTITYSTTGGGSLRVNDGTRILAMSATASGALVGTTTAHSLELMTGGTSRAVIDTSGNFKATAAAGAWWLGSSHHLFTAADGNVIALQQTSNAAGSGMALHDDAGTAQAYFQWANSGATDGSSFKVMTANANPVYLATNSAVRFQVSGGGLVGVGVPAGTTPSDLLHVHSTSGAITGLLVKNASGSGNPVVRLSSESARGAWYYLAAGGVDYGLVSGDGTSMTVGTLTAIPLNLYANGSTRLSISSTGVLTASAYTVNGGVLYTTGVGGQIVQTSAGSATQVLHGDLTFGAVTLGTDTTGNYVATNVATANQTTVSGATGNVTIGLSSTLVAPGTLASTTTLTAGTSFIVATSASPAATDACTAGRIVWDADYVYVCTASSVWKRAALTGGY